MKHFFHLVIHELRMQLIAPSTYIAATLFLLLMSSIYTQAIQDASQSIHSTVISESFYKIFWFPVLFVVPLLTMKSIAEERRLGTLETLMTTPATAFEIVLSKFLGSYLFYMFLWALTLSFPLIVIQCVSVVGIEKYLFDGPSLFGSYLFIATSGALYIALGIFASSLTRSQLVAGMLSFSLLFFIIVGGRLLADLPLVDAVSLSFLDEPIDYIRTFKHLEDFSRGIIDSRPFFLYFSTALLCLGVTTLVVEAKV